MAGRCVQPFLIYKLSSYTISFYHLLINKTFTVFCQASNILYVDQPVGTGFSYTTDESDICHDEEGISNDLYDFLQVCFLSHVYLCVSINKEIGIMHSCLVTCDWNLSG